MSTTFVPPKPDQWQGPSQQASGFVPPPVDSWQGPAKSSESTRTGPSIPMYNREGLITDKGAEEPMGTMASIATAPLAANKSLLESSGKNVSTGLKRMEAGAKQRAWYNPFPSSEELGGVSDVVRGAGEAALPIALGTNPVGTAIGTAAGVPVGAAVEGGAKAIGVPQGTSEFLGTVAGGVAGSKAADVVPRIPGAIRTQMDKIDPVEGLVRGLKPTAHRTGFASTLQRSLPELKATESALPNKKISGVDDLLAAIDIAKKRVWNQYQKIAGPNAKAYADASPIADAMEASIPDQLKFEQPGVAKQLVKDASVYRKPLSVEQLESFLKTTNAQLDSYYAKNPLARRIAAGKNPDTAALEAKASAIRDVLYNALDAEGEGGAPRELKQRYGSLLEMERAAWPRRNVAARQQPESLSEQLGKWHGYGQAVKGGVKMLTGNLSGAADIASGLAQKELASWVKEQQTTDALVRRAFENYNGSPTPVQAPPPFQPKGLLTKGDIITPPPKDTSSVHGMPLAPHQQVNRMRTALPQGGAPFTQGTGVPDMTAPPPPASNQLPPGNRFMGPSALSGQAGDITDLVPVVNPATGKIEYIPRFAKGGVIRKPTLGLVGEAGPERIVPVEKLQRTPGGRATMRSLPQPEPVERTAAQSTVPEKPEALKTQLQQLADGQRKVVMFPHGTPLMKRPKGFMEYTDADRNAYIFNPQLTSQPEIDRAIESNSLPDLLGPVDGGMGVPDKSALRGEVVNVAAKQPGGATVQSAATDRLHMPQAIQQAQKITPPGGNVAVEDPAKEVRQRMKAQVKSRKLKPAV
jgi:hypothetical protein